MTKDQELARVYGHSRRGVQRPYRSRRELHDTLSKAIAFNRGIRATARAVGCSVNTVMKWRARHQSA